MRRAPMILLLVGHTLSYTTNVHVNFTEACEDRRKEMIQQNPSLTNETRLRCGAQYSPGTNASISINTTLTICRANYGGWGMSNWWSLSQWVGPLVGFLLLALVFVMAIPRHYRQNRFFDLNIFISIVWLVIAFVLVSIDIVIWIVVVFALSGPMMVGVIDESLKDWRILRKVEKLMKAGAITPREARFAITLTLIGTFEPREDLMNHHTDDLVDKVITLICDAPLADVRPLLCQLLDQQASYGIQVGVPAVFFLGAFTYALFDASSRLGDNVTAHAIAFGLWYGIIVLTAAASSCVLSITKSSTIEPILGRPPIKRRLPWLKQKFSAFESPYR